MQRRVVYENGLGERCESVALAQFQWMNHTYLVVVDWRSGEPRIISIDQLIELGLSA